MSLFRLYLRVHRYPAAWLVALALAVRLLVPAGYMPMAGRAGLEICAGQTLAMPAMGAMHAAHTKRAVDAMPTHGTHHGKAMPGDHDRDCGFAAAVGAVGQLSALILPDLPAPVALPAAFIHFFMARPGLGLAAPPPPKTGPPIHLC